MENKLNFMLRKISIAIPLGVMSAFFSYYFYSLLPFLKPLFYHTNFPQIFFVGEPGIIFGFFVCLYVLLVTKAKWNRKWILFVFLSAMGCIGAYGITGFTVFMFNLGLYGINSFALGAYSFLGGVCGAGMLVVGLHSVFLHLSNKVIILLVVLSGILGLSFLLDTNLTLNIFPLPLLLIWQTGMLVVIAFVINKKKLMSR